MSPADPLLTILAAFPTVVTAFFAPLATPVIAFTPLLADETIFDAAFPTLLFFNNFAPVFRYCGT